MDEPKIIFKYQGRLNKLRNYEDRRKRERKSKMHLLHKGMSEGKKNA